MKPRLVLGFVFVIVVVAALWLVRGGWQGSERAPAAAEPSPLAERPVELVDATPQPGAVETAPSAQVERAPVEPGPAAPPLPAEPRLAEIRGRFLLEGGAPATGMSCEVQGWGQNQEMELKYGVPEDWTDPSGVTDADGRLSIRFDPPRAFQFMLEAKVPGYAGAAWRWGEIERGAVVDLGEVTLQKGGTIEGRIVDRADNALIGQKWIVYARSIGLFEGEGRDETQVIGFVDPATGHYRVEDVMPGRVELRAHSSMADCDGPPVTLAAGETLEVDIVYDGPDNSRRITVTMVTDPFYLPFYGPGVIEPEHVELIAPDGQVRTAAKLSSQSYSFDHLEPGVYAIEIDDPSYLPWSSAAVKTGTNVTAHLKGSSSLVLQVVDPEGRAVTDYSVRVEFRNERFNPREFELDVVLGKVEGMLPGDYTVRARAGDRLGAVEVDGLAPGESRAITIVVGGGLTVAGRVIHGDGTPVAEVEVQLLLPAEVDDSEASPILTRNDSSSDETRHRKEVESTITDEQGRFRFAAARAGTYVVRASADGSEVNSTVLEVSSASVEALELVLPRGGFVRGRVRGPGGETCAGLTVGIEPKADIDEGSDPFALLRRMQSDGPMVRALESDGRFELGPVPAGPATVYLCLPEQRMRFGSGIMSSGPFANRVELGQVTVEEGAVVERDFEVRELPGTIVLLVTVNGDAVGGLQLHLDQAQGGNLMGETDARGTFGPTPAFAGSWTVRVSDPDQDWSYTSPTSITVKASEETRATIAIDLATASLAFLDRQSGEPLAGRSVAVYGQDDDDPFPLGQPRETDANGRASFTLTPGEYRFVLDPPEMPFLEPDPDRRSATVTWTAEGPLASEVRL